MDEYMSEKEQWEWLKTWLRENSLWILGGIGLGALIVSGWFWWNARTDGEIFKILVNEGDWVEENQQIAQISAWNQEHDVAVDRARLAQAKAKLAQLIEGAKPEAIAAHLKGPDAEPGAEAVEESGE